MYMPNNNNTLFIGVGNMRGTYQYLVEIRP